MGLKGSHFGRLKPIPGYAFVIDFKPEPACRQISLAEAAALKTAMSEGATHGFWDDIGDFFSDVADAVVDVVQIVVQVIDDVYTATVHFLEDELKKITDMVIEFASQVRNYSYLPSYCGKANKTLTATIMAARPHPWRPRSSTG